MRFTGCNCGPRPTTIVTLEDKLSAASCDLEEVNTFAAAEGYYQLGEIRRLRGDLEGALAAFSRAREMGTDPQPGEALVRLQQGDSDAAWTALQMALGWQDRIGRIRLLRTAVEVALARDCLEEAETLCRELESGATEFGTPGFRAWAAHARGALLVASGEHSAALDALHKALREYRTQQCRYETAQVYEWMAKAHVALGEHQAADADTATAESIYRQLGVEPVRKPATPSPGGLTKREVDILTRIAGGATNKQVAEQVFLSEKTVRRHLANILQQARRLVADGRRVVGLRQQGGRSSGARRRLAERTSASFDPHHVVHIRIIRPMNPAWWRT